MPNHNDFNFMARALRLARRGLYTTDPNPRVGCALVADGEIVAEGWHERAGGPHAEIVALKAAGERARGATAYVTLEPCCHQGRTGPCADALIDAGVARVVAAMTDPNPRVAGQGLAKLKAAGIAVEADVLADAAAELNPGFIMRMTAGRPLVRVKIAASVDGRTALASGESQWITGSAARADVHRLRARSSAILTGIGTALADDPRLTVRDADIETTRQPLRVVIDGGLRLSPHARLFGEGGNVLIFTATGADPSALEAAGATVERVESQPGRVDLAAAIGRLANLECNEVLVEAGARLNGALFAAGLVDEIVVYLAPTLLGEAGPGLFALPELTRLADRPRLRLREARHVGNDLRLTYEVSGS
ncbi:MAG TPA: bifunctional diaminohydroxyphosphoribosylaminopyrimidine deaminase/5-amino-6-(5-phosphoribosylamino)uracil reductase RibD [Gammaproteobacteria bacterium]|nr:bifunctional diaminohydroxyphosphoribosylaminopyrimidine deaminase/5-amino-6-(5-phosphoribosylamino)uracil reductase RibD [Gammaproteobacteria bacterium]